MRWTRSTHGDEKFLGNSSLTRKDVCVGDLHVQERMILKVYIKYYLELCPGPTNDLCNAVGNCEQGTDEIISS